MSTALQEARAAVVGGDEIASVLAGASPDAISIAAVASVGQGILQQLEGAGPVLQPLLDDPLITDVLVNGTEGIWIDRGRGLERINHDSTALADPGEVRKLAVRLAATCGQRLDDASPIVDGTFPSGVRLHAVLPPLAAEGTLISLRTQRAIALTVDDLVRYGTVNDPLACIVTSMISAKANVMISGSTGSGKTTLLAALLGLVPTNERIVIIEESAELRPTHPHCVHLQVRHANVQGTGEVSMSDLVRAAMRMRPDRLILGECRGAEVRDVLAALNTGHEGGWATIHANTAQDVPARLVALGALAGMTEETVAAQAAAALDAVIHINRTTKGRRIDHISVLSRQGRNLVSTKAVSMAVDGLEKGPAWEQLVGRLGLDA
ncbi:TadA family conjugal transfer-associated ATPase [Flaviflexus massiliensis]|uniref:TadA family conjugal transfer-associated ATPase n=1 Tax=Flaviflexus massiliensis TaxID=1522309 RepID=UPI0006D55FFD|nr:TadA family conjugal transfer-associated ATPase [Flaviflexus massiliensis]